MINCCKSILHKFQSSLSQMNDKSVFIHICVCVNPGIRVVMLLPACEASVTLVHAACRNPALVNGSRLAFFIICVSCVCVCVFFNTVFWGGVLMTGGEFSIL